MLKIEDLYQQEVVTFDDEKLKAIVGGTDPGVGPPPDEP